MQHLVRAFTLANRARVPEQVRLRDARPAAGPRGRRREVESRQRLRLAQVFARRVRSLA